MAHNPNAKVAHNYSIVDDLVQSLTTMSTLEALQRCCSQRKELLTMLGAIDPLDSHLMTLDLD